MNFEFRKIKTIPLGAKYDIHEQNVKNIVIQCWELYYNSLDKEFETSIQQIKNYFPECRCFFDLGKLRFMHSSQGSYITIVHNNELSPKIFLEKINSIITNTRIVKMLKDLHILQNKMENLVKEITQSVEEIPSLIQNKEY